MLDKLERKFGRYALTNLTLLLVAGQAGAFVLARAKPEFVLKLALIPAKVIQGEVWRVVTWVFIPFSDSILFIIFELWLLLIFGRALEAYWGAFKYNVFLLIGFVLSVGAAFLVPSQPASNYVYLASIFLAFAYLNPTFEIRLMFILPVQIRWLGYLQWIGIGVMFGVGSWQTRAMVAAGVLNFFIFFGPDIWIRIRGAGRRTAKRQQARIDSLTPNHTCTECGLTDLKDPQMQFRYCSKCAGKHGYCSAHLKEHEHKR